MIEINNGNYCLSTDNISYVFRITEHGDLENLHYGKRIDNCDVDILVKNKNALLVNTLYQEGDISYGIDAMRFEYSFPYRGDSRSASLILLSSNGSMTDFVFDSAELNAAIPDIAMPLPKGYDNTLRIIMRDNINTGLSIELWYILYTKSDVIARFVRIINNGKISITINKIMSAQFDTECENKKIITFNGAWGRERIPMTTPLKCGKFTAGSYSGMSSAECNPFFIIKDENSDDNSGSVYGFNLIYSASHEIGAEITPYGGLRITHGIQSEGFAYKLKPNEVFDAPVSVTSYSSRGVNGVSGNMHRFVNEHIVNKKQIPIMLNSWEAVYFKINENKLTELADKAAKMGFEGVVIDDGWFKGRNDDTTSLGDWVEDIDKFPNGINSYARYLKTKNLKLGIWIEPEMVSEKSDLFIKHADWALKNFAARKIIGRNQLILDLSRRDVVEYVFNSLVNLVKNYGADYIKWDFNRRFSDIVGSEGSAYYYRYVSGLYKVLKMFTNECPNVIIENCASGGGRFDLGMFSYCHVGWVSDNTEPLSRVKTQEGTAYGYPIGIMLNHISASPNHQTKRLSKYNARRDTAFIGAFGAQYDIAKINADDEKIFAEAVAKYKKLCAIVSEASMYRLCSNNNISAWEIFNTRINRGLIYIMLKQFNTVSNLPVLYPINLNKSDIYNINGENINITASGKSLMNGGIVLPQNYQGIDDVNLMLNLTDGCTLLLEIAQIGE